MEARWLDEDFSLPQRASDRFSAGKQMISEVNTSDVHPFDTLQLVDLHAGLREFETNDPQRALRILDDDRVRRVTPHAIDPDRSRILHTLPHDEGVEERTPTQSPRYEDLLYLHLPFLDEVRNDAEEDEEGQSC